MVQIKRRDLLSIQSSTMQGTKGLSLERLERVNKYGVCLTGKHLGGQTPPTKENRIQNCGNFLHRENMLERSG